VKTIKLKTFFSKYNYFLIIIILLFSFALLYFFYHRQRNQEFIYISLSLYKDGKTPINIAYNSVPYWVENSISIGDRESDLIGRSGVEVISKESYDWYSFGKSVNLVLRVNAIRDRTGIYLYKNKPLAVGGTLDLKLPKAQVQGVISFIGSEIPVVNNRKLKIVVKGKQQETWLADKLNIGDEIKSSQGMVVGKITDKKSFPAEIRVDTASGQAVVSYDNTKRDIEITVELLCREIDKICYFMQDQKIKVNEGVYLPFNSVSINFPIISISDK